MIYTVYKKRYSTTGTDGNNKYRGTVLWTYHIKVYNYTHVILQTSAYLFDHCLQVSCLIHS